MKKPDKVKVNLHFHVFCPGFLEGQSVFCRFLLSLFLARRGSCSYLHCSYIGPNRVGFVVIGTRFSEYFVGGCDAVFPLSYLLEIRFWIHMQLFVQYFREGGEDVFFHECLCLGISEVQIDGSEESLERVGYNVRIGVSSGKEFPSGYDHMVLKTYLQSDGGKIFPAHQRASYIGQFSFGFVRKRLKEQLRRDKFQHCISQEFQALVALGYMNDILVQCRTVDECETVSGDVFIGNFKGRYE